MINRHKFGVCNVFENQAEAPFADFEVRRASKRDRVVRAAGTAVSGARLEESIILSARHAETAMLRSLHSLAETKICVVPPSTFPESAAATLVAQTAVAFISIGSSYSSQLP